MLFSLNYSPEMADLIREGLIHVDRIMCAEWPDMIAGLAADPTPYDEWRRK